jgi:hypothetical protein
VAPNAVHWCYPERLPAPQPDYTADWLAENVRLRAERDALRAALRETPCLAAGTLGRKILDTDFGRWRDRVCTDERDYGDNDDPWTKTPHVMCVRCRALDEATDHGKPKTPTREDTTDGGPKSALLVEIVEMNEEAWRRAYPPTHGTEPPSLGDMAQRASTLLAKGGGK